MKFGIIGAMEEEVAHLKSEMDVKRTVKKASMEFFEGTIGNTEVVVVKSGIAKVNAGICVQILVDIFEVTHIINTGVAGSLNAKIDIGDIVLSEDACYHDVDATIFGYKKGEVPQLGVSEFKGDKWLIEIAQKSIKEAASDVNVFVGRVCSGDQFIADDSVKQNIIDNFGGLCTEMEGAAIAQASYLNNVPFIIIRAISDKADGSGSVDYPTFEKKAAKDCAALVDAMIRNI
ncbi:MAG: 5'-methylthioadenosine/adenosylhomocysteine nucleosidase [Butyrivibrio sp.]|nr:5'-methylthioadenosine/adenosylhomocysteine nucleosidase [Butyrivibrio sp.]